MILDPSERSRKPLKAQVGWSCSLEGMMGGKTACVRQERGNHVEEDGDKLSNTGYF